MIFNKTAQDPEESEKNTFISVLSDEYLEFCMRNLEESKIREAIKGQFPNLKYTLSGFDPSDLNYQQKVNMINILFKIHKEQKGEIEAENSLENLGLKVKDRLGVVKAFNEGVKDMPGGVFENHKIENLSEEELRKKLKEKVVELKGVKESLSKNGEEKKSSTDRDILEMILYNTSDGVYALNGGGKVITFNETMEKLTGYTEKEAKKKPASEVIRLFDSSDPVEMEEYCDSDYSKEKLTLVARNGEKKFVKMISSHVEEDEENSEIDIACVVTLKDVTEDVELETMKLDFVSMAAHELRTPLTSMRGYLSLLNEDIKDSLKDPYDKYIENLVVNADRLHVLIENLLNISRIERGKLVLEKDKYKWEEIVKEVVSNFKENAEAAGVDLKYTETKSKLPEVLVDETMISEVISNLIDNAIKYTEEGGRITVFVEQRDNKIVTHIKDTGLGIPRASIPHLFKKFYRVSTVLKEGKKGTGLGLFISKEIVKLHKGDIWVESTEGEGSTFSFSLPIVD